MGQETIIYLTNISIGVILVALLTHYWLQQGRSTAMKYWIIAAWVMTLTDVLFAVRWMLPHAVGRVLPTLGVTLGLAVLYLGSCTTARQPRPWKLLATLLLIHGAILAYFMLLGQQSSLRIVWNGFIWFGISVASFFVLRKASAPFWKPLLAPANVFLLHAIFHLLRVVLAVVTEAMGWAQTSASLHGIIGDLEVSFFMVAIFVSLLIATLQQRHEELMSARAEVETLSGLLPICAWCKKIRDDDGYWQQVEEYFSKRVHIEFTHGICAECLEKQTVLDK